MGTIAAGVAKGKADMVLIAGHDGGTGNSPISSIKHAGIPWEIGVAETQQTLVMNRLRDRIRVQADGQMRTGRDIVIAALLGAEEYGFGTISLVTIGCIMMRKCHLNTCPVGRGNAGPASARPIHRQARARGELHALRGAGRAGDHGVPRIPHGGRNGGPRGGPGDARRRWTTGRRTGWTSPASCLKPDVPAGTALRCTDEAAHDFSLSLDKELIERAKPALENGEKVRLFMPIRNCNRTVGATLSAEVSTRHGRRGCPRTPSTSPSPAPPARASAAFSRPGSPSSWKGTRTTTSPRAFPGERSSSTRPAAATFRARDNIITGNVNLFGATGGEVYINGMAGERFAVRNSGAIAVVEGLGDHGCEYMTGGTVVVLGRTGVNFAAGMSGGIAYVLDEDQLFDTMCNLEMVDMEPVTTAKDRTTLKELVERHVMYTRSEHATRILRDWDEMLPRFVKVMPIDYRKALERMAKEQSKETEVVGVTEEVYR